MSNEVNVDDRQIEALKALADWSKWLVSLQTALIFGALVGLDKTPCVKAGIISFLVSIVAAGMLSGAVPNALQSVPVPNRTRPDIYEFKHLWVFKLRVLAFVEHTAALVGLLLLIVGWPSPKA